MRASALYAVDLEVFKEDPMGCCKVTSTLIVTLCKHHCFLIDEFLNKDLFQHVAIKNPLAVPRAALAPPKIAPGVQMVKEAKKEVYYDV